MTEVYKEERKGGVGPMSSYSYMFTGGPGDWDDSWEDEEPEDFAEAIGEQAINMLPLLGKPIMASRRGWSSDLPVFEAVKGMVAATDDLDFTRSDSRAIAESIAVTTGIPYTAIRRLVKAVEEDKPTALLGAR